MTKLVATKFGKGWLYRFQTRHGLTSQNQDRKAGSAKSGRVLAGREELRKTTIDYDKKDSYNMDETAFNYCAVAEKSVSAASVPGQKV